MSYSEKVLDHYNHPRNIGHSTRATRAWEPASSARPNAATS